MSGLVRQQAPGGAGADHPRVHHRAAQVGPGLHARCCRESVVPPPSASPRVDSRAAVLRHPVWGRADQRVQTGRPQDPAHRGLAVGPGALSRVRGPWWEQKPRALHLRSAPVVPGDSSRPARGPLSGACVVSCSAERAVLGGGSCALAAGVSWWSLPPWLCHSLLSHLFLSSFVFPLELGLCSASHRAAVCINPSATAPAPLPLAHGWASEPGSLRSGTLRPLPLRACRCWAPRRWETAAGPA